MFDFVRALNGRINYLELRLITNKSAFNSLVFVTQLSMLSRLILYCAFHGYCALLVLSAMLSSGFKILLKIENCVYQHIKR